MFFLVESVKNVNALAEEEKARMGFLLPGRGRRADQSMSAALCAPLPRGSVKH
jgi:hypothetical protein